MPPHQWLYQSPAGSLYLVASQNALTGAYWSPQPLRWLSNLEDCPLLSEAVRQLDDYFQGRRRVFDLPLAPQGTDFQKRVWFELAKIPYGQTVSYKDIAVRIQNEKGVRAVGLANGRNPISIFIPCHRVIGSNGRLTGYAGGLESKSQLLQIERGGTLNPNVSI